MIRPVEQFQISNEGAAFRFRSAANEKLDRIIIRKRVGDVTPEVAIAADDQDALHHDGLATIRKKTMTSPLKAGQPKANHQRCKRL